MSELNEETMQYLNKIAEREKLAESKRARAQLFEETVAQQAASNPVLSSEIWKKTVDENRAIVESTDDVSVSIGSILNIAKEKFAIAEERAKLEEERAKLANTPAPETKVDVDSPIKQGGAKEVDVASQVVDSLKSEEFAQKARAAGAKDNHVFAAQIIGSMK